MRVPEKASAPIEVQPAGMGEAVIALQPLKHSARIIFTLSKPVSAASFTQPENAPLPSDSSTLEAQSALARFVSPAKA